MHARSIVTGALIATMSLITVSVPAMSAPLMSGAANLGPTTSVEQVRDRGRHYHGYHRGGGGGAGALIGGLAAGAILGGVIAAGQANAAAQQNAAYCSRRYRSYDPASGTYLNNDGNRYPCP